MQPSVFEAMAHQIHDYVRSHSAELEIPVERLTVQIRQYVQLRQQYHPMRISNPKHKRVVPEGWSSEDEEIWNQWFQHTFVTGMWKDSVISPLFVDPRYRIHESWEQACPDWAEELETLLPTWIKRSFAIIDAFAPLPEEEEEEEVVPGSVTSPIGKSKNKD